MRFQPLSLDGVFIVEPELRMDPRGFFARTFCQDEFASHGLDSNFVQCNGSWNAQLRQPQAQWAAAVAGSPQLASVRSNLAPQQIDAVQNLAVQCCCKVH